MTLTREIKEFALDLGNRKVGIIAAKNFPGYINKVKSRGKIYDFLWESPTSPLMGAKPGEIMPFAKSIIILVWDYAQKGFPESLTDKIGRMYQTRCYNSPAHRINGTRLQLMKDFLVKKGCEVNSNINIPARWAAAKAV